MKGLLPYKSGKEYVIKIKDIIIPVNFLLNSPRWWKIRDKERYFKENSIDNTNIIIVDKELNLKDNYCSYILCKKYGIKKCKVLIEE